MWNSQIFGDFVTSNLYNKIVLWEYGNKYFKLQSTRLIIILDIYYGTGPWCHVVSWIETTNNLKNEGTNLKLKEKNREKLTMTTLL